DQLGFRALARRALDDDALGGAAAHRHETPVRNQAAAADRLARRLDERRGRAIVAGQVDDADAGIVLAEAQEEADVGTPVAVDRLIRIADGAEVRLRRSEQPDERVLERI